MFNLHYKNVGFILLLLVIFFLMTGCQNNQEENESAINMEPNYEADSDYYTELYRPQYHLSPESGNLADPNGMVYFEGEYHQFHQQNGQWAHAISKDLVHWEYFPLALTRDELGEIWSGSAVVDWEDTSGFFDGEAGLVAFFTHFKNGVQSQSIAYSKDKGRTWEKYEGNPVIPNPGIKDFRDPKVFWHDETEKWVMVVSADQTVYFYGSNDLKEWEFLSEFGHGEGAHMAVWECPDLFELPVDGDPNQTKWVLHVSIGDNHVTDGSTAQYFIGEFDGTTFTNNNPSNSVLWTDYGRDFYAAQSYSDIPEEDGRRIWLAWMSNWRYPYQSPTDPWMGMMSVPRELYLKTIPGEGIRLIQQPVEELNSLRASHYKFEDIKVNGTVKLSDFQGTHYEFEAVIEWDQLNEVGLRVRKSDTEETLIGFDAGSSEVFVDRTNSGKTDLIDRNGNSFKFGKGFAVPINSENKQITLHGYIDESSIELFVNDGERVLSNLIFPNATSSSLELYSIGGEAAFKSLDLYHLKTIWRKSSVAGEPERIVLSQESVDVAVGESAEVQAMLKPDWLKTSEELIWKVEDEGTVKLTQLDNGRILIEGVQKGSTKIKVTDPQEKISAEISVFIF